MLEIKTIRQILNSSIEGKVLITKTEWLEKNELKKWASVDSLIEDINKMEQGYKDIGEHNAYVSRICFDLKNKLKELEKDNES